MGQNGKNLEDTGVGFNDADCQQIYQGIENVYNATV